MPSISKETDIRFYTLEKDIIQLGQVYKLEIKDVIFSFSTMFRKDSYNSITFYVRDTEQVLEFYQTERVQRVRRYGEFMFNSVEGWERLDDYLQLPNNKNIVVFYKEVLELIHKSYDFLINNKKNFSFELSSWDLYIAKKRILSIIDDFRLWLKVEFPNKDVLVFVDPYYDLEILFDTKQIYNCFLEKGLLFKIQKRFNEF